MNAHSPFLSKQVRKRINDNVNLANLLIELDKGDIGDLKSIIDSSNNIVTLKIDDNTIVISDFGRLISVHPKGGTANIITRSELISMYKQGSKAEIKVNVTSNTGTAYKDITLKDVTRIYNLQRPSLDTETLFQLTKQIPLNISPTVELMMFGEAPLDTNLEWQEHLNRKEIDETYRKNMEKVQARELIERVNKTATQISIVDNRNKKTSTGISYGAYNFTIEGGVRTNFIDDLTKGVVDRGEVEFRKSIISSAGSPNFTLENYLDDNFRADTGLQMAAGKSEAYNAKFDKGVVEAAFNIDSVDVSEVQNSFQQRLYSILQPSEYTPPSVIDKIQELVNADVDSLNSEVTKKLTKKEKITNYLVDQIYSDENIKDVFIAQNEKSITITYDNNTNKVIDIPNTLPDTPQAKRKAGYVDFGPIKDRIHKFLTDPTSNTGTLSDIEVALDIELGRPVLGKNSHTAFSDAVSTVQVRADLPLVTSISNDSVIQSFLIGEVNDNNSYSKADKTRFIGIIQDSYTKLSPGKRKIIKTSLFSDSFDSVAKFGISTIMTHALLSVLSPQNYQKELDQRDVLIRQTIEKNLGKRKKEQKHNSLLVNSLIMGSAYAFKYYDSLSTKAQNSLAANAVDASMGVFSIIKNPKDYKKVLSRSMSAGKKVLNSTLQRISKNINTSISFSNIKADNKMIGLGILGAAIFAGIASFGRREGEQINNETKVNKIQKYRTMLHDTAPERKWDAKQYREPNRPKYDLFSNDRVNEILDESKQRYSTKTYKKIDNVETRRVLNTRESNLRPDPVNFRITQQSLDRSEMESNRFTI